MHLTWTRSALIVFCLYSSLALAEADNNKAIPPNDKQKGKLEADICRINGEREMRFRLGDGKVFIPTVYATIKENLQDAFCEKHLSRKSDIWVLQANTPLTEDMKQNSDEIEKLIRKCIEGTLYPPATVPKAKDDAKPSKGRSGGRGKKTLQVPILEN